MRRLLIACAAAAAFMSLPQDRANAMPLAPGAPLALNHSTSLLDQVQYGCRLVWRCGPWGCGWRRVCWRPPVYYGAYAYPRPYWGYGYGGYRPWGYGGFGYRRYW